MQLWHTSEKYRRNGKRQTLDLARPCTRADVFISLIFTLNPDLTAVAELMTTLRLAQPNKESTAVQQLQLNAKKKRHQHAARAVLAKHPGAYKMSRSAEKEKKAEAPEKNRSLPAREVNSPCYFTGGPIHRIL
jgi:hypothetical protein